MPTTETNKSAGLVRGLGVWSATAVVIGGTIGQAIFLVTSNIALEVGSVGRVLAAWVIGGVIVLCGTFCYAELGAAMPKAGGDYVYRRSAVGCGCNHSNDSDQLFWGPYGRPSPGRPYCFVSSAS